MAETSVDPPAPEVFAQDLLDTERAGSVAIRGAAVRVGGYALTILLSVGSSALLFRHLGVVDGGRYVMFLSVVRIRIIYLPWLYKMLRPLRPLEAWIYRKLRAPAPRPGPDRLKSKV